MKDVKRTRSNEPLRAIAFIFIFWGLMTLAVSIPYVNLGPEEKAPDVRTGDIGAGGADYGSGSYIQILWIIFISVLSVMFVAYTIIAILRKDKEYFKGLFFTLIVVLLMVGMLLSVSYMSGGNPDGSSIFLHRSGDGSASIGNETEKNIQENTAFYGITAMVVLLVGAIVYMLISSFMTGRTKKVPSQTEELMEKIDMAMRDLEDGKEVQDVIIRAYDEMCRVLARKGVKGEKSMTPREFQETVIEQTGIAPEPVKRLTSLFEEAKYSSHPIGNDKRKEALLALGEFKKEMEKHEMENGAGDKSGDV